MNNDSRAGRVTATLILKEGFDRRLRLGHPWVYASQVAAIEGSPGPGDLVDVRNASRYYLGRGTFSPRSQITVRLLTRREEPVDEALFRQRLEAALQRRRRLLSEEESFRLVFSEGDFLPGLVVDKFEDVLVVAFLTVGMDRRRDLIVRLLQEVVKPRAILERSDAPARRVEGLQPRVGLLAGKLEEEFIRFRENGLLFAVDPKGGQKTGYFFDQKLNRRALAPLLRGREGFRVLDAFCYVGSFGVHAAAYGAASVLGIDSSREAVQAASRNASMNGLEDRCRFEAANAFDRLREMEASGERFDLVILDPPAFAKNRRAVEGASRGYKEINLRALKLVEPGGYLITCSCSYPIDEQTFRRIVLEAALDAHRELRLVEARTQGPDHPIHLGVPETQYLKCLVLEVF